MTGKIFRSCFLVGLAIMVLCTALFVAVMASRYEDQVYQEMEETAVYVKRGMEESGGDYLSGLEDLEGGQRLTWIAADGTVLYDSEADPAAMENHADREEVIQALEEGTGQSKHLSNTLLQKTLYYAVRLDDGTVLRLSCQETTMGALIISVLQPILWIVVLALVLSGVLASRLSRQITKPINNIDLENPRLDDAYEELFPLVGRLREQNRTISRQMEALSRRQREFAALAENMSEGVLLLDSRYNILYSNQSAYALLGGEEEKPESLRQETCRKEIWEAAGRALAGCHAESLMRAESHIFEILANPVTANGQVTGVVVLMVDVTEREERESLRREFSANVSHELKTPLTSISGFAEIIQNGIVKPEDIPRFAGNIYVESQRLITLVDDILNLSRLDEADVQLEREQFDLTALARDVAGRLKPAAKKNGVVITVIGDKAEINGVKSIVDEMIYNLCENAVKYNRKNGRVTLTVSQEPAGTALTVTDTGIGIPKADVDRVFERFYRVDKSHSKEIGGTGLGLSIVKHGAAFHNAKVSLNSTEGEGTTVRLVFPA